jgi:hypothetical protein
MEGWTYEMSGVGVLIVKFSLCLLLYLEIRENRVERSRSIGAQQQRTDFV